MKHLLLAALLVSTLPTLGQTTPTAPSAAQGELVGIEALDAKNGFRKYKFGTPLAQMPGLEKRGKNAYIDPMEIRKVGDVNLSDLKYTFYDNQFSGVILSTTGNANVDKLLAILTAQYGDPQRETVDEKMWHGNVCSILWHKVTSYGSYNTSYSSVLVYIFNNALSERETADSKEKAKKAGAADL